MYVKENLCLPFPFVHFFKHTNVLEELCVSLGMYPQTTLSEHTLVRKLGHTLPSEAVDATNCGGHHI